MPNDEKAPVPEDAETPYGLATKPFPWGAPAADQDQWTRRHRPIISIGVWIDEQGKGCVRAAIGNNVPVEIVAVALGLIHEHVDRMIGLLDTAQKAADDASAHPC